MNKTDGSNHLNSKKLGIASIGIFGMSQFFYMLFMNTATTQINYYVTDVLLIPAAITGVVLILGRVLEVVGTPFIGVMIEKVKFPWGNNKYQSWIFIASFPFAVFYTLMFTIGEFNLSLNATIAAFSICLALGSLSGNLVQSVHTSLISGVSYHDYDRKNLSKANSAGNYLAKAATGFLGIQLIVFFTARTGSESTGFALVLVAMSVLLIIGYFILGFSVKKYLVKEVDEKEYTIREMWGIILRNKPLLITFGTFFMKCAAYFLILGLASYYFKYVVGDYAKLSIFFTITNLVALGAVFLSKYYFKLFANKTGFLIALTIMFVSAVIARFAGYNYVLFTIIMSVFTFGDAMVNMYTFILFAEAIDYGEYVNRAPLRGLSMSLLTLALDGSRILQQIVIAVGLSMIGYSAAVGIAAEETPVLLNMITLVPAVFLALGIIILKQYSLDPEKITNIRSELKKRREG